MAPSVALVFNLFGLTACICSLLASLCDKEKLLLPLLVWIPLEFGSYATIVLIISGFVDFLCLLLIYGLWWFIIYSHREHLRQEQKSRDENSVGPSPLHNQNKTEISMIC